VPPITKSCSKPTALSPSQGPKSITSMTVAPYGVPPTLGTSIADDATDH
jgi:hypothetical protein